MDKRKLTLCVINKDQKILLGMKKRGFGAGRWNGFGGKVEPGESLIDAAKREVLEESGLIVNNLEKLGEIDFEFRGDPVALNVSIFFCRDFEGEHVETEEMLPKWFGIDEIPFDLMWPDDKYWFPMFLEGKKFKGKFVFEGQDNIVSHQLEIVREI